MFDYVWIAVCINADIRLWEGLGEAEPSGETVASNSPDLVLLSPPETWN